MFLPTPNVTNTLGIRLQLMIGPTPLLALPAPAALTQAISSIEVTCDEDGSGFAITFVISKNLLGEFTLLSSPLLTAESRVIITIWLGLKPYTLMDGVVSHLQVRASDKPGSSTLVAMGRDLQSVMDRTELSAPYEYMDSGSIVRLVLARYAMYGMAPVVAPTMDPSLDLCRWQTNETDLQLVSRLAKARGWVFYIRPKAPMVSEAYFGPDPSMLGGLPQTALNVDMGPSTNVTSIHFAYDTGKSTAAMGYFYLPETDVALPSLPTPPARIPPLAAKPAAPQKLKLVRGNRSGNLADVEKAAMAQANESLDCLVASGEIDSMRYGNVLLIRRTVGVRGAGRSFDGLYRVTAVTHHISGNKYTQQFTAKREGLYSILPVLR